MPVGAAVAAGVAGVAGSLIQANAAEDAASKQAAAANHGIDVQEANFQQIQQNLLPYMRYGQTGLDILNGTGPTSLNMLTKPFSPADLANTPGYQFTLQQGEQAVANGLSAQGLASNNTPGAVSGPAQKAAINYAEGLASTTYNQQLQNYLSQNQQIYNMLAGVVGTGANAAAGLGGFGTTTATNVSNLLGTAGAAQAAGTIGSANAFANGLNGAGNSLFTAALLNNLNTQQTPGVVQNIGAPNSAGVPSENIA